MAVGGKTSAEWEQAYKDARMSGGVDAEVAARQAYADAFKQQRNPAAAPTTVEEIQNPTGSYLGNLPWGSGGSGGGAATGNVFDVGGGNATTAGQNKPYEITNPGGGANPGGVFNAGGGIVNSALGGITPWNITAPQTVAGQIQNLTDPNSPLIQQARTRALQGMNARGIINSSLGLSAADAAAYDAAMPIAQADAATQAKAAGYNADQQNQQYTLDKNLSNSWNQALLQSDTTKYTANLQAETQKLNNESQQLISRLNNEQQVVLANLNNENNRLLNTNRDAATAYNNSMQYINAINSNPNMDEEAKTRAVAQVYYNLDTQLKTLSKTSGLDVRSSLSLANAPGFDDKGNYIGFPAKGAAPAAAPPAVNNQPGNGA